MSFFFPGEDGGVFGCGGLPAFLAAAFSVTDAAVSVRGVGQWLIFEGFVLYSWGHGFAAAFAGGGWCEAFLSTYMGRVYSCDDGELGGSILVAVAPHPGLYDSGCG